MLNKNIMVLSLFVMILDMAGCRNNSGNIDALALTGEWVGQTVPGDSVELFANGFISTGGNERDASFPPDGKSYIIHSLLPQMLIQS